MSYQEIKTDKAQNPRPRDLHYFRMRIHPYSRLCILVDAIITIVTRRRGQLYDDIATIVTFKRGSWCRRGHIDGDPKKNPRYFSKKSKFSPKIIKKIPKNRQIFFSRKVKKIRKVGGGIIFQKSEKKNQKSVFFLNKNIFAPD